MRFIPILAVLSALPGCGSREPPPRREQPPGLPMIGATAPPATTAPSVQPPIGALGIPLGTVVDIRAVVVAGESLRMKQYQGEYLLRVTHVDGRALAEPRLCEFGVPAFLRKNLAHTPFELYEMKHGRRARELDDKEIARLERGYVGKEFKLTVYETGQFGGIPKNWPADVPLWADVGFGFSTSLVVLAERG